MTGAENPAEGAGRAKPRSGYPTLHDLLKAENLVIYPKRPTGSMGLSAYREQGLQLRTKRRKKLHRPRVPTVIERPAKRLNLNVQRRLQRLPGTISDQAAEFVPPGWIGKRNTYFYLWCCISQFLYP